MPKRSISLFIVDDHPLYRQGICAMVDARADMMIAGQSDGAEGTAAEIEVIQPDIVLVDLTLPGDSAYQLIERIRSRHPSTRTIALSVTPSLAVTRDAVAAGAAAVLTKGSSTIHLIQAISRTHAGEWYFSPDIAGRLIERFINNPVPDLGTDADRSFAGLTPRERDVLRRLADGKTPKDIAYALGITRATVDVHKTNLMHKMGFRDLTDLMRFAMKAGFIDPARWIETEWAGIPEPESPDG